jgi:SAM-dependent methyltransferase
MPDEASQTEAAFVLRHLPPDRFPRLLDLCCGPGRHARLLAGHGYYILGVDKNPAAIRQARELKAPNASFKVHDMREVETLPGTFDGAINMWHSFGYFDDDTNRDILRQLYDKLRPGGRLILDIYNRDSLARFPAIQEYEKAGVHVESEFTWSGKRLTCRLRYGSGASGDTFEWRIYTPGELLDITESLGFRCLVSCAWWDEQIAPSADDARMQFVLERPDASTR